MSRALPISKGRLCRYFLPGLLLSSAIAQQTWAQSLILPEGMAIPVQTRQDVSSKSAHAGDEVELAVARAVTIGGVPVIAAGSPAVGKVVRVRDNGLLGRSGKIDIQVSSIKVGQIDVPVRGQRLSKGRSGTLGAVGAGILFLPLAVVVRGKDVSVPAGTTFDVYVDREVSVSTASAPAPVEAGPLAPPTAPNVIRSVDPNEALAGS